MEITPKLILPNGERQNGFEVKDDGRVFVMCADNVLRQLHPAVVAALGDGRIAPGVWQIACRAMQNPRAPGILLPPSAWRG